MPIHRTSANADGMLSNIEICALAAPRPQLLVSASLRVGAGTRTGSRDQSCNTPRVEYPFLRRVYGLLGAEENVQNVHFDSDHDYGRVKRAVVYPFFARHLQLDLTKLPQKHLHGGGGEEDESRFEFDETFVRLLRHRELQVWQREGQGAVEGQGETGLPRLPPTALRGHEAVAQAMWGAGARI